MRAKVYKIFEMPLLFQELFREKSKKDRCVGTQERKQMLENKELKTTVNSVNPSCLSALFFGKVDLLNPAITSASIPKQELYALSYHPR